MGSWAERMHSKAEAAALEWARWKLAEGAVPYLCADKPGGTIGE